jgi:hypothetical protein
MPPSSGFAQRQYRFSIGQVSLYRSSKLIRYTPLVTEAYLNPLMAAYRHHELRVDAMEAL